MKKMILAVALMLLYANTFGVDPEKAGAVSENPDTLSLDELVVTGSRVAAKRGNVAQRIELISADKIQLAPSADLTSVLKTATGVNIVDYGGLLSGISIRGFMPEFDNLGGKNAVLIDGRPAASGNLSLLNVANAERVEVLRGPASSIYGPTAMGGVVNIITKKSRSGFSGRLGLGAGSYGSSLFEGVVGGAIPHTKINFDLAASRTERSNFKTGNGGIFRKWLGGEKALFFHEERSDKNEVLLVKEKKDDCRGDGKKVDYSDYAQIAYSARLGYEMSPKWNVNLYYDRTSANDVGSPADIIDEYYPSKKNVLHESTDLSVNGTVGSFRILARGYYGRQQSDAIDVFSWDGAKYDKEFMSCRSKLDWKGTQLSATSTWGFAQLTVGTDYSLVGSYNHRYNRLGAELSPYTLNHSLGTLGIYQQTKINMFADRAIATIGLRYDANQYKTKSTELYADFKGATKYNDFVTPSVGLKYKLTNNLHLNATYGKGYSYANPFHLTGYYQHYSSEEPQGVFITAGNPNLKNQESDTYDLGFNYSNPSNGISFEATYFYTKQKNNSVQRYYTYFEESVELFRDRGIDAYESNGEYYTADGQRIVSFSSFENAFRSRLQGFEISASCDFGVLAAHRYSLLVFANYVPMLKAEEERPSLKGIVYSDIFNVAKSTFNFGVDYSSKKIFSAGLSGRYVGYRYDHDWSSTNTYITTVRYPRMMTVDAYAKANIKKRLSCILSVNNVTDENYYEKRDYNLLGRNFKFKIVYCF